MAETMLLTVREAARLLGIGRDSVYALIREGRLRAVHIGRRIRVPRTALERWIESETRVHGPGGGFLAPSHSRGEGGSRSPVQRTIVVLDSPGGGAA